MDAAFGMEYLHSKSIVHFDLKCDNLLVSLRDPQRPVCKVFTIHQVRTWYKFQEESMFCEVTNNCWEEKSNI